TRLYRKHFRKRREASLVLSATAAAPPSLLAVPRRPSLLGVRTRAGWPPSVRFVREQNQTRSPFRAAPRSVVRSRLVAGEFALAAFRAPGATGYNLRPSSRLFGSDPRSRAWSSRGLERCRTSRRETF